MYYAKPLPLNQEARRIARYLLNEEPFPDEVDRYVKALDSGAAGFTTQGEQRLWGLAMRSKFWLGLVDAGMAIRGPHSPIRHRIYLMLALLEASPRHTAHFLSKPYGPIILGGHVLRSGLAVLRSLAGFILVWILEGRQR